MQSITALLGEILVTSGVIWAATMALKKALRKHLSPRAHLTVWLVLIVRLMLPASIETGIHIITTPASEIPALNWQDYDQGTAAPSNWTELSHTDSSKTVSRASVPEMSQHSEYNAVGTDTKTLRPNTVSLSWNADPAEIAVSVWVFGILIGTALSISGYDKMRRDVINRLVPGTDPLHLLFQDCLKEAGIRKRVVLAVQNKLAGPALMYPNIVLIPENVFEMDPEAARMALRHELTHFARRDHLKSAFLNVLRIVWWFNPFVWMAVRTIREDIETACDNDVVSTIGKGKKSAYAKAVLSMFGRTETCPAVLGMAFGGARKNAERRIRGIYMKKTSSLFGRAAAVCLACILSVACLTTACQPTPATEAVVNQKDGIPEEALIGESETPDPEATTAPAAKYFAAERWNGTIDKSDNFKVTADIDIMMPEVSAYPVEELAAREITQELADRLIEYFVPGAEFYSLESGREKAQTKAEWEKLILDMRQTLAEDIAAGDTEAAQSDQELLDEWTKMYEDAPETAERIPATTEFAYHKDYAGENVGGPNYINIATDGPDGSLTQISVRRRDPEDPMQFPYFSMWNVSFTTQSQDISNQESIALQRDSVSILEEPDRSEEIERLDELEAKTAQNIARYDSNTIDLDEAQRRGEQLLEDLGIRGAQIFECDKALFAPDTGSAYDEVSYTEPGAYLEFQRENGGIPCVSQASQNGWPDSSRLEYSAPFIPERGSIVFDADWNVRWFNWENPTEPLEILAPDSRIISADEARDRLAEELYRNELAVSEAYIKEFGLNYVVDEMKLVMGYTEAPDNPDHALAVPAWYMLAQGQQLNPGENGSPVLYNQMEVMISALDGAPILMPGTAQSYNYRSDEAY